MEPDDGAPHPGSRTGAGEEVVVDEPAGPQARDGRRLVGGDAQRHERMSAMMRRSLGKEVLMKQQPTLFLTVGLPCTGKTTAARRIEIEQRALRLTKDEWVKACLL